MNRPCLAPLPADFVARWAAWYPDAPAVGFLLREAYGDRWLRIHSLPESKRYATSGWEYAELLRRHNAVADDLLGDGTPCAVLVFEACDVKWIDELGARAGLTDGALPQITSLPSALWNDADGVAGPVCLFGGSVTWRRGTFDGFICAVADDRVAGLLVEFDRGRVYAPYDGGADLFFATEAERDVARERYRAWLSSHPGGL